MSEFRKFIKKYCYISVPVLTIGIYALIYWLEVKKDFVLNCNDDVDTLIQIAGTLVGFLLTAMTIFLSLPKDTEIMKRIKKYKHHLIFSRCVIGGLLFSTICILCWILKVNYYIILAIFLLSLEETLMSAYYIYKLCIYNFQ